jgi:hyperosmotically inducible periplasmic protein
MDSHRKIFHVSASCVVWALIGVAAACRTAEPARIQADDTSITAKIKTELAADSDLSSFSINVKTNDRVVTLEGHVKTEVERGMAERIARETDGVRQVVNLVKVGDLQ